MHKKDTQPQFIEPKQIKCVQPLTRHTETAESCALVEGPNVATVEVLSNKESCTVANCRFTSWVGFS